MFNQHQAGTLTKQLFAVLDALAWMAACLHKAQVSSSETGAMPSEDVCIAAKALHTLLFLQFFQYHLWGTARAGTRLPYCQCL